MEKKNLKMIPIFVVVAITVFGVTFGIISLTANIGKKANEVSYESASDSLARLYQRLDINILPTVKENVDLEETDLKDSLPDISRYPAQVEHETSDYIEIFSSTEKATVGSSGGDNDRWLVDVARDFNREGFTVDGRPVSVMIRGIASGVGMDYISSGKYVPDVFSPSNELWGDSLKSQGVPVELRESSLAGNVAGIVLSKAKHQEITEKYGYVSIGTITEAVAGNELAMGYTNPFASSTGANFLLSTLYSFDKNDPFGETAVTGFETFQTNIPFVAYTTLQMKESAKSGVLDGFVFEYQQFANTPDLRNEYTFTPFGVRHDNPVYAIGNLSETKSEILDLFLEYCKNEKNQKLAEKYGFNAYHDYRMEIEEVNGENLTSAQKLWKEKKSGNKEIIAVFVADISGSMRGEPLSRLKESLLAGAKKINNECSIGLVTFSDEVNIALPVGKFDLNQRSMFTGAVNNMYANGGTAMFDGIVAAEQMLYEASAGREDVQLMIFVLSDGEPNRGFNLNDTRKMMEGLRVPIYTIGYNANLDILGDISQLNEAAYINADTEDVVYTLENLLNAQM